MAAAACGPAGSSALSRRRMLPPAKGDCHFAASKSGSGRSAFHHFQTLASGFARDCIAHVR